MLVKRVRWCVVAVDPTGVPDAVPDAWVHPFLRGIGGIAAAVDDTACSGPELMGAGEKARALVELARLESRVAALRLRVLACADDVAAGAGARDAGAWLAHRARLDRGPTRRDHDLATALADRWTSLGAALGSGTVNLAQARVCAEVLAELPTDLDPTLVVAVEDQLVALAEQWAPRDLKILGRKLLEAIDPDTADAHEARKLDAEEHHAHQATSLRFHHLGEGITRIVATLPDHVANRLATYLDAYTSPRHHAATTTTTDHARCTGTGAGTDAGTDAASAHVQRGHAFTALLEHLDPTRLPAHGGDATTLIVTIGLDQLRTELATADLIGHDLDKLTAGQARRLACTAEIIPAVLGTTSEVLDLGRSTRLFTRAQRKALRLRDQHCRAEGCPTPATWTEAHHKDSWANGGPTNLDNAISLCSYHHHRCHDTNYHHEYLPNGDVRYRRRT